MLVIQHVNTIWEMFYTTFSSFIRSFRLLSIHFHEKTSRFFMSQQKEHFILCASNLLEILIVCWNLRNSISNYAVNHTFSAI